MKNKIQLLVVAALSIFAPAAMADEASYHTSNSSLMTMTNGMMEHLGHTAKASDVMGLPVKNSQDETLGKVKDFAVDLGAGRILYVIVSAGGVMGVGGTLQAVPPGVLHLEVTNTIVHLDPDIAQLNSQFESSRWSDECDTNRVLEVYGQYHQVPYFATAEYTNLLTPRQLSTINDSGSSSTTQPAAPHFGPIVRASKVIGSSVVNLQGEKLGKVENLMVNLPAGRVVAVIVSSGGFLGMNGELSAVPAGAFRFDAETNNLQLDATKASLANAPHFSSGSWPDMDQPAYTTSIYSAYTITPYFNTNDLGQRDLRTGMTGTNTMRDVDNTAQNARDRNRGTLTPLDQGTSKADINTTAQIRKQIIAQNGLSVYAQNVKIITRDGKVTLRGPVNTTEEKSQIAGIAAGVAGGDNVDNQLEVKMNPGN